MSLLPSRRWLRWLLGSVATLLVLYLLLWALVPVIAKNQLEKQLSLKLGRQVSVGGVEFKPWSLEATIHELRIAQAGAQTAAAPSSNSSATDTGSQPQAVAATGPIDPTLAQVEIKRIYVNASAQSLLRLAPVLDAIEMDAPTVRLTQHSWGHFDIDDVLEKLAQTPPEPDAKPLQFALYNMALRDGRVERVEGRPSLAPGESPAR